MRFLTHKTSRELREKYSKYSLVHLVKTKQRYDTKKNELIDKIMIPLINL